MAKNERAKQDRDAEIKMSPLWIALLCVATSASALAIGLTVWFGMSADINELDKWGSYLAGTSAPIAFFWLVVAVILQSLELKAQRQEIRYTQLELKGQREVMEEQAVAARRQADLLETQTKILQSREADAEFETLLQLFHDWAKNALLLNTQSERVSRHHYVKSGNPTAQRFFLDVTERLSAGAGGYGLDKGDVEAIDALDFGDHLLLLEKLINIAALEGRLSGASKAVFDEGQVPKNIAALEQKAVPILDQLDKTMNTFGQNRGSRQQE